MGLGFFVQLIKCANKQNSCAALSSVHSYAIIIQ